MVNVNYKLSKQAVLLLLLASLVIVFLAGCATQEAAMDADSPGGAKIITGITTMDADDSFNVIVQGNQQLTYTSVKQPFPLAVILYFPDTTLENIAPTTPADSDTVSSITATQLASNGKTARIEIALKHDAAYEVARETDGLMIAFTKSTTAMPAAVSETPPAPVAAASAPAAEQTVSSTPEPTPAAATSAAPVTASAQPSSSEFTGPAWINRIDFASEDAGKSSVIIGTTIPVQYELVKVEDKLLRLELMNTNIPDYRKRPLITTSHGVFLSS